MSGSRNLDSDDLDDLQFVLQETRTLLLQQILSSESGSLSVPELSYRNADLKPNNVRYHLREMVEREIVEKRKVPPGDRVGDLPNTFFRVTDRGERLLDRAGLRDEVELWTELYDRMDRSQEIERIERFRRATQGDGTDDLVASAPRDPTTGDDD